MSRIVVIREELARDPVLYGPLTDPLAADEFNVEKVILTPIETVDIYGYLVLKSKLVPIEESTLSEAKDATRSLATLPRFDIRVTEKKNKLEQILDDLIAGQLLVLADKTAIMSLGNKTTTTGKELGVGRVQDGEITRARA